MEQEHPIYSRSNLRQGILATSASLGFLLFVTLLVGISLIESQLIILFVVICFVVILVVGVYNIVRPDPLAYYDSFLIYRGKRFEYSSLELGDFLNPNFLYNYPHFQFRTKQMQANGKRKTWRVPNSEIKRLDGTPLYDWLSGRISRSTEELEDS
jgi:hypothetical protein